MPDPLTSDAGGATLTLLQVRALRATALSVTISDPTQPDNPIIWANPGFERATGYSIEEAMGRNCRFLQGPATDPGATAQVRSAIAAGRSITVVLLNYRKDGSEFWNQLSLSPILDGNRILIGFVGIQMDVSERIRAGQEREKAHAAERAARQDAERAREETEVARRRLALLTEATTQLASTLDVNETLNRLVRLVVPVIADWVAVDLLDTHGDVERTVVRHYGSERADVDDYRELIGDDLAASLRSRRVMLDETPVLVADARQMESGPPAASREPAKTRRIGSLMHVPLVARGRRVIGSITFLSEVPGRVFTPDDLSIATDIGRRASTTLDNARLYEREHRVAEALQRSLLPDLPEIDGLTIAARYAASDATVEVGGDFYEILPLPNGSVGLAVGDVVGHDLSAAAAMGHLRGLLRAAAWTGAEAGNIDPARVLAHVDRLVQGLDVVPLATLLYGQLLRPSAPSRSWHFTYASAGHPPALVRRPDGTVELLDRCQGILLGVTEATDRPAETIDLPPGATLVVFTDGLVEQRDHHIDAGYARLIHALHEPADNPERLVDRLLNAAGPDGGDDKAIIAVHVRLAPPSR